MRELHELTCNSCVDTDFQKSEQAYACLNVVSPMDAIVLLGTSQCTAGLIMMMVDGLQMASDRNR